MSRYTWLSNNKWLVLRAVVIPAAAVFALIHAFRWNGYAETGDYACAVFTVLLIDLASLARGATRNGLVVLASLSFGFGLLNGIAAAMLPKVDNISAPQVWGERPVLGWGPTAAGVFPSEKKIKNKSVYKVTYSIDKDLLRVTRATQDGPTIAFFGDSFTFGFGLDDADTLPQSFADIAPGFNVVNLGYSGYSPSQVLREMQVGLFDKRLRSPRLLVLQTAPWHAERTSCRLILSTPGPHYVKTGGTLAFKGPCATGLWRRVVESYKSQAFYQFFLEPLLTRPSHADIETYIGIVDAITKLVREKYKVPFVILYVYPDPRYLEGTGYTDAQIEAALRGAGAHLIDTRVDAKPGDVLEIPDDGHPTGTANRLLARKLVDDLNRTMPNVLKLPRAAAER